MTKKSDTGAPTRRGARRGGAASDLQGEIGLRLRALYSEAESEPIPTELLALLEQLDIAEEKSKA